MERNSALLWGYFGSIDPVLKERQLSNHIADTKEDQWNGYLSEIQDKGRELPAGGQAQK